MSPVRPGEAVRSLQWQAPGSFGRSGISGIRGSQRPAVLAEVRRLARNEQYSIFSIAPLACAEISSSTADERNASGLNCLTTALFLEP
jgi:hypothetical protein